MNNPVWLDHYMCQYQMSDTNSCVETIERAKSSQRWGTSSTFGGTELYSRDSSQLHYLHESPAVEHEPILLFAQDCLNHYLDNHKHAKDVPVFGMPEGYNILRYKPTEAYHAVHTDWGYPNSAHRHLTFCMYLNDVESGGETEFPEQNLKIKPVQGQAIIFPATWLYPHRSLETSVDRYVFNIFYGFFGENK